MKRNAGQGKDDMEIFNMHVIIRIPKLNLVNTVISNYVLMKLKFSNIILLIYESSSTSYNIPIIIYFISKTFQLLDAEHYPIWSIEDSDRHV